MSTAIQSSPRPLPPTPWGMLPPRMRLLHVVPHSGGGGWLTEALDFDSASDMLLQEALGGTAGMARLREEIFDAVLLHHQPGELDALEFVEGLRAGGSEEPVIVLGRQSEQELAPLCFEVGADAYVCFETATTRSLIWIVARAIERHSLIRDNHRLAQAERKRLEREHMEAQRLLEEQRVLVHDLEVLRRRRCGEPAAEGDGAAHLEQLSANSQAFDLPEQLVGHYRELLRAYVIMGSGNLAKELNLLAELLVSAGISARQAMHLHLHALEELLQGLGSRSTRHVMTRADLLVLEVIVHMAEGYRYRYQHRVSPPQQRFLPGFGSEQ